MQNGQVPLGPEIGQCCGGRVQLCNRPELMDEAAIAATLLDVRQGGKMLALPQVYVFGAGHVGKALALALSSASGTGDPR